MIKVYKSPDAPSSLATTTRYDGEDVKLQLLADQHDKCYICERRRDTDYEIEHHKSVELKPIRIISLILPQNENKIITRENKTAVIQHFSEYIRWEQYLKSF